MIVREIRTSGTTLVVSEGKDKSATKEYTLDTLAGTLKSYEKEVRSGKYGEETLRNLAQLEGLLEQAKLYTKDKHSLAYSPVSSRKWGLLKDYAEEIIEWVEQSIKLDSLSRQADSVY
ncbi:MAG: hypothetical protein JW727_04915 [Candidatus Aenigmarchaeota archaeon]|nr:hypothetical protein [Candidatus Aenigmarchaeota archaeon]